MTCSLLRPAPFQIPCASCHQAAASHVCQRSISASVGYSFLQQPVDVVPHLRLYHWCHLFTIVFIISILGGQLIRSSNKLEMVNEQTLEHHTVTNHGIDHAVGVQLYGLLSYAVPVPLHRLERCV